MKAILNWGTVLVSAGLIMVACRVTSDDDGGTAKLSSAKFEDGEISGWNTDEEANTKATHGIAEFGASNMIAMINGGAGEYANKGLSEGFAQYMKKGVEQTYVSWIMDFGTEANAKLMYDDRIQQFASEKEVTTSFPETKSFLRQILYGYDGYAIFGKYMVWVSLDGFGANKGQAKNEVVAFLLTIEQKLKDLKLL
ncbi:MAG TPA: hypothetical protein VHO70_09460 [Chitinispirillaceae bacterium]|nr:hypothetical protein [Chitinispirillaceae bacterium]